MLDKIQRVLSPRAALLWLLAVVTLTSGDSLARDPAPYTLQIETMPHVIQGQYCSVPIKLLRLDPAYGLGGFRLNIGFDNNAMSLHDVTLGAPFDSTGCEWEYLEWYVWDRQVYPYGLLHLEGRAEFDSSSHHPSCGAPDSLPATLCTIRFLVNNDRNLECEFAPIRFYWEYCSGNTLFDNAVYTLLLSSSVYDDARQTVNITDPNAGFPTFFGAQTGCDTDGRYAVDFINGGLDIACAGMIEPGGDVNLNGLRYEPADIDLFIDYFLEGLSVFTVNCSAQILTTDVNQDGLTLSLADLVYLIRNIIGDAGPLGYAHAKPATCTNNHGVVSIDSLSGGALLVLAGEHHLRSYDLLANGMVLRTAFDGTNTRVLIHPPYRNISITRSFSGPFVDIGTAQIVSIELATQAGLAVDLTVNQIPWDFALSQNYPNPFNPITTVGFALPVPSDWHLTIYNSLGQIVQTQGGSYDAGYHAIPVDASGWPSGVYLYTLTAGDFTQTRKMMLIK